MENEGRERSFEEKCRELLWDNILSETAAAEKSLFWCRTGPWSNVNSGSAAGAAVS